MNSSGRFGKKLAPKISIFYGSLNITGMSSGQAKGTFKIFNIKTYASIMMYTFRVIHYYFQMFLRILEINI